MVRYMELIQNPRRFLALTGYTVGEFRALSSFLGGFGDSYSVPCKGVVLQWVKFPPGNWSLQPVAVEAGREGICKLWHRDRPQTLYSCSRIRNRRPMGRGLALSKPKTVIWPLTNLKLQLI
jgi:hypothetical protein